MNKPFQVYLCGKVGGKKWDFIEHINEKKAVFFSSDGRCHSEHDWGCGQWIGNCSEDTIGNRETIIERCLKKIKECDFVVAYLDKVDSYGSIAEIAYASAMGKQIYIFIPYDTLEDGYIDKYDYKCLEEDEKIDRIQDIYDTFNDTYWFVGNFPSTIIINNTKSKTHLCEHVLTTLCNIESEIEMKFYNKVLFNGFIHDACIETQVPIERYRVDFLVNENLIVELDGHNYHSSKEQKASDNKRDRKLTSLRYKIFRYTGSEVWKEMDLILDEIKEFIKEKKGEGDESS